MAIAATDILIKLSIKTGAAGNASAQADPNASLGKYISTTQLSGTALNNLFDDISGLDNAALVSEYRCLFVHNNHATLPLYDTVAWLSGGDPAGGANITLAADTVAASAIGASAAQALEAATDQAPGASITGLSYSTPSTSAAGVALGTISPGQCKAFWVKRTGANSAAISLETITLAITGSTAA